MTPLPPAAPPSRSWALPIAAGATLTFALHAPALLDHLFWLPMCCCAGLTAAPVGLLPAGLALRRDPYMGAASGFAVAFIGVGLGAVALAAVTLLQGFDLGTEALDLLSNDLLERGYAKDEVDRSLLLLQRGGPVLTIVTAGLLALAAGVSGAVLAAWVDRRHRRRLAPPPAPQ